MIRGSGIRPGAGQPDWLEPELATLTEERFSDPDWIFERKWDGIRCLAFRSADGTCACDPQRPPARTHLSGDRRGTHRTSDAELVVDGEVVAFVGRTSFERLQGRSGITDPAAARAEVSRLPLRVRPAAPRRPRRARPASANAETVAAQGDPLTDPLRFTTHRNTAGEDEYRKACAAR